jgi:hypothetical protein
MILIPDDPIIRALERTGYPPWIDADFEEIEEELDDEEDEETEDSDELSGTASRL